MAKPKRYFWMKLKETFMTSDTIDYFMSQPDGANYVVLYQMLCLKTINTGGRLSRQIGEIIIPYDAEKIQRDCKWFSIDTVRVALKLYQAVGLVYEDVDGTLVLVDHKNLVGSETDAAARMRSSRENRAIPSPVGVTQCEQSANIVTPEIDNRDKRLEIENREKEKERKTPTESTADEPPAPSVRVDYEAIRVMYNKICTSFSRCTSLSDARKKAIKARFAGGHTLEDFKILFTKAEASSFLKGANNRNWTASFDWLIKDANMAKVLDGNYDDRKHNGGSPYDDDDLNFIPN